MFFLTWSIDIALAKLGRASANQPYPYPYPYCPKKSKNSKIFEFGVVNHISSKNFHPDPDPVKSMYFLHFL